MSHEPRMNTSQFFVAKRPIAWIALISVLVWGVFAYCQMPQRQDPIIPVSTGVVVTPYPGAEAEKVEQEVTRKIERKIAENASVEHVRSISRPGLSICYVDLFESVKNAELVWQDIRGKLGEIPDLPRAAGRPTTPFLNKDFGDTVAVMLTISSPPVPDLDIELRAKSIRDAISELRRVEPAATPGTRWTGVLVCPSTVARPHVLRIGRTLGEYLTETGVAHDVHLVDTPTAGLLDVALSPGKSKEDLLRATDEWWETAGTAEFHPDAWHGFWTQDLSDLETQLRRNARDKYTYRELRDFADRIRDRLKQSPFVAQVDEVGVQDERVWLTYSGRRLQQFGIPPLAVVKRIQERNINIPGGSMELPRQNVVVRPTGDYASADEIGQTVMGVSSDGYPVYLRDLVEVTRGYEDPSGVLNFRTVTVPRAPVASATPVHDAGSDHELQTGRAITISVRQVKGTHIAEFDRDLTAAMADLKQALPPDLRVERTSNEPEEVHEKVESFDRNFLEAVAIVILTALLFMEWRSALVVAISIPVTVAMTLGMCSLLGVDLQQVSIAALIIAGSSWTIPWSRPTRSTGRWRTAARAGSPHGSGRRSWRAPSSTPR